MQTSTRNDTDKTETEQDDGNGDNGTTTVLQIKRSRDVETPPPPIKRMRLQSPTNSSTSVPPTTISMESLLSSLPPLAQQTEALPISPPPVSHQILPHHLSPLQNEGVIRLSLPDHEFQNIITQYNTSPPSDGYNHLKVVEKSQELSTEYELPSWLTGISQRKNSLQFSSSLD